jgi:predicted dehydrogenase
MNNLITVAQIGCGYWGPNLLRNLMASNECNVKIVVDIDQGRRNYVKRYYPSVDVTDNVQRVFEDKSIDAVVIAAPVATHFGLAITALESEKHVLVEKPMGRSVTEVEQIGILAKRNNLVAMVGHTFLYNAAVRYLKKLIESGEVGDIRYIYSQRLNLGRIRSDVDVLWNLGPHDISIIQYLLGNPTPILIEKYGLDYVQNGIYDVVFMKIIYPSKIMAHIHLSWLDPRKVRQMTVVGSKKMVIYDDISENKITIYDKGIDQMAILGERMDFDKSPFPQFNYRSGDIISPKINYEEPLKTEISHFFDCIQNGKVCLTDTEHAKEVVGILSCK